MRRRKQCLAACLVLFLGFVGFSFFAMWRELSRERLSVQLIATLHEGEAFHQAYVEAENETYGEFDPTGERQTALKRQNQAEEATVLLLLREDADPNVRDFPVVNRSLWEELEFLLKRMLRHSPAAGPLPASALAIAVKSENTVITMALLKAGANDVDAEIESGYGRYPLVNYAAYKADLELVKELTAHGANLHKSGKDQTSIWDGISILESALSAHDTPLIPEHKSMEAAEVRERQSREQIFQLLRAMGVSYRANSEEGEALLCAATAYDLRQPARELLMAGVSPNANPDPHQPAYGPLDYAAANDDIPLAKLLLQYGASVKAEGLEAPILYVKSPEMARLLLEHGANIRATQVDGQFRGDNALDFACMQGDTRVIPFLIEQGLKVNTVHEGISPIEEAAGFGGYETVRLLLQHGAGVGPKSRGEDALWWAIAGQHFDSAKLILRYGAALTSTTRDQPLTAAIKEGSAEMALELLKRGADVNAKRGEALRVACVDCDDKLVEILLKHGANPTARQANGMTAIQIARRSTTAHGRGDETIALLKKYGAKR